MELKEILGSELFDKIGSSTDETLKAVVAELGKKKLLVDDGSFLSKKEVGEKFVPKHEFNEKNELVKSQKELIQKHEADMKVLKESASGNEGLQKQIAELQKTNKETMEKFQADQLKAKTEFEANQKRTQKEFALKEALMGKGVNDESARNLLSKQFDVEKLELDDKGTVKGIDELIKPIKDNKAFSSMFGTVVLKGAEHQAGELPEADYFTREQVESLSVEQMSNPKVLEKVNKSMETWSKK